VMMLNLGAQATEQERQWLNPGMWVLPSILALILIGELIYVLALGGIRGSQIRIIGPKQVGIALFGPYLLGVELASLLLLAGLIGAYHLGRRGAPDEEERGKSW
jgi:NADH-quinone oxidoreductase subunit J